MEGPRLTFLVILLLFIFFSPDQPNVRVHSQKERERLRAERQQDFNALANFTYGDLPTIGLNLTGCKVEDGFHWDLLPQAQDVSNKKHIETWYGVDRAAPVYHDIDGSVKGDFIRLDVGDAARPKVNLTQLDPGTDYISRIWERNITEEQGSISLELEDLDHFGKYLTREIKAEISIFSESAPGNGWDANLRGLHFPSGSIVLTTSSRKFNSLPALPHFTLRQDEFERATATMNKSLTEIWERIDQGQYDDTSIYAAPKCELIVWLHQKPLSGNVRYIDEIEQELREPDGAPIGQAPPMAFSATVFSPDCGYILQANTVFGPKAEAYSDLVRRMTAAFCIVLVGQIFLLKRQMERCATPSTRSRVSYHTFGIAAFGDGLILFAMVGLLMVDLTVFLLAGAAAFLSCIHVAFLEVKFIFDIWTVQVGDPAMAERERQRRTATATNTSRAAPATNTNDAAIPIVSADTPAAAPAPTSTSPTAAPPITGTAVPSAPSAPAASSSSGLPLPATAQTATPPTIILPSDQDTTNLTASTPTTFASLYSKFYFTLINLSFLTLWATVWPQALRHFYFNLLSCCFFSLWLPQIHRNVMRNCRKALAWEYVLGSSVLRAVPVLYWYIADRNLLGVEPRRGTATMLGTWLCLQIAVLLSQEVLGARWFVKEKWCPPAYDYHPVLYDDLEAGGLPIGEVTSASEGKDASGGAENEKLSNRKSFDCAICMNEIDVPVVSKDEKKKHSGAIWLEQRNYMVTPCRHIFHSECLEGWMGLRLVCPVCREGLPPL